MPRIRINKKGVSQKKKRHFRYFIYLLTAFLIVASFWTILPNLSSDPSDYEHEIKTLANAQIEIETYKFKKTRKKRQVLVLNMKDGTRWEFSGQHFSKFWNQLQDSKNIGKSFKLYHSKNTQANRDPRRIEIDGVVVYDFEERHFYYNFVLIATGLFMLLSGYLHRRAEQKLT